MDIQEYFNIRMISKLLKYKTNKIGKLEDLLLNNTKDEFLLKANDLLLNCDFVDNILEYFKSVYIKNVSSKVTLDIEYICNESHKCIICDKIKENINNIDEICDIISEHAKKLLKYNTSDESKSLVLTSKLHKAKEPNKTFERVILPSHFKNKFIKNVIGFLFINLNEANVTELISILTFGVHKDTNSSEEIIENITLIIENCQFIKIIKDLINKHDYHTIIKQMKVFKRADCNLSLLLYDIFNTVENLPEFLDFFKDDITKTDEEINNYLLKGNYPNRKFTIFRWHVNTKYNQWNYLFDNIEYFRLLKEKGFFLKLIGLVRYFMLPLLYYKNNPHNYSISNYQKLCEMSIKDWNKYYKKHIEKFYVLNKLKIHLTDVSHYHKDCVTFLKSYSKIIKNKPKEVQRVYAYLIDIDYDNQHECFLAFQLKLNDDCKEVLNIFNTLNTMNKVTVLNKFINDDKVLFLNDVLSQVIQRWINIDKDRSKIFPQLNSKFIDINNEYHMSYLYDIDKIVIDVLKDDLNVKISEDAYDDDIADDDYSPETVQRMIDELKD